MHACRFLNIDACQNHLVGFHFRYAKWMFVRLLSQPNVYSAYSAQFYSLGLCLPLLGFYPLGYCWLGLSLLGILHTSVQGWCCTFDSICFHSPKEQWTSPYLPNSFSYFGMHGRTVKLWNKNYLQSFHTLKNWMFVHVSDISVLVPFCKGQIRQLL